MITVFNLKSESLQHRLNGRDFTGGDVYLFISGSPQACCKCHKTIPSGVKQVIQRRRHPEDGVEWNDRYHLNCCPGWLTAPVARLLEE